MYPAQTTGVGVAAQVTVDATFVQLSLTGTTTHQIAPQIKDAAGTVLTGTSLTLTAAANASGGNTVYTGTITGGGSNAFAGFVFVVSGFDTTANNGTFVCKASTTTTLTLDNGAGVSDTHAGTAVSEDSLPLAFVSYSSAYATVSSTGLITAVAVGNAVVEVSYPTFSNSLGNISSSGNPMNGLPWEKVYKTISVLVTP